MTTGIWKFSTKGLLTANVVRIHSKDGKCLAFALYVHAEKFDHFTTDDNTHHEVMSKMGRSRSEAKLAAQRKNLKKAQQVPVTDKQRTARKKSIAVATDSRKGKRKRERRK